MIVFLHGPDTFRARKKLKEIQDSYEKAHHGQVRSFYFNCKEARMEDIQRALETASLFEQKKLVILENPFDSTSFCEWLQEERKKLHASKDHVVVLFQPGEVKGPVRSGKTNNTLYQWLRKHVMQQEFLPLSVEKTKLWIARECSLYNVQITPKAQEALARAVGNDLWAASNYIRMIASYKASEAARQVKESDIALFVKEAVAADIFATIDSIAAKNKKQAFGLLYRHIQKGEAPHYIFSMVQYQFRTLLEIKDRADKGLSRQQIAQHLKIHPYVLQKGMRVAEKFSFAELTSIYEKLFRADWRIKTGRANPEAALDLFLATL